MKLLPPQLGKRLATIVLRGRTRFPPDLQRALLAKPPKRLPPERLTTNQQTLLEHDGIFGHLTVELDHVYRRRKIGTGFRCECTCGQEVILRASEIIERPRLEIGCGSVNCTSPPPLIRAWYDVNVAWRLQIGQLALRNQEFRATIEESDSLESVAKRWLAVLRSRMRLEDGMWWLSNPRELAPDAVLFRRTPSAALFPHGEVMTWVGEEGLGQLSLREMALTFSVPQDQLVKMKLELWDHQILEQLMKRGAV